MRAATGTRSAAVGALLSLVGLAAAAPADGVERGSGDGAGGRVATAAVAPPIYTIQARGYAAVLGYPADEVPSTGGDEEAPPEPPPAQTCPDDARGIDEPTRERLDALVAAERPPAEPEPEVSSPTPRGQPIKFDFGLADVSLRSDPGSHAVASGFYVDLGGGQDPWTTAEADGYASGHAREEERCARLYAGQAGGADDTHVWALAPAPADGAPPSALAYTRMDRTTLTGLGTVDASVTRVVADSTVTQATASVVTIVEGVDLLGTVRADSVISVITYVTDGTDAGTTVTVETTVEGLMVDGQPVALTPGGPPVAGDGVAFGLAAPQVRRLDDGTIEVDAGGLYVGADQDNPLGLQSKQAVSIGGARLRAAASRGVTPSGIPPQSPRPSGAGAGTGPDAATPGSPFAPVPSGGVAAAPVDVPATAPGATADDPTVAAPAVAAPAPLPRVQRLGVYRTPPQTVGAVSLAATTLLAWLFATSLWARHRSWRVRVLLGAAGLRWVDRAYRAFLRG